MPSRPRYLVENLFSPTQFPDHIVTAEEEATDHEADRFASGLRRTDEYWASTTENSDTYIQVQCDRVRSADFIWFDRGHNVAGKNIILRGSENGVSFEDVFNITLPTVTMPGPIDQTVGVITEGGEWVKHFDLDAFTYWRIVVAASAGFIPRLKGGLGTSLTTRFFDFPWGDEGQRGFATITTLEHGWQGRTATTPRREGTIGIRAENFIDYDQLRYHFGHWVRGRPMWMVADSDQADRAVLTQLADGAAVNAIFDGAWIFRRLEPVSWIEYNPELES